MNKYRIYLFLQILVVILVIAAFKLIDSKRVAAIVNAILFFTSSLYVIFKELKIPKSLSFWGACLFIIFGILPVVLLRILHWDSDFNSIQVFGGFTGADLHRISNYPFVFLLLCFFIDSYRLDLLLKREKKIKTEENITGSKKDSIN